MSSAGGSPHAQHILGLTYRLLRFSDKLARRVFPIFFSIALIFFVHTSLDVQLSNHSTDPLDFYGVGIAPSRAFD